MYILLYFLYLLVIIGLCISLDFLVIVGLYTLLDFLVLVVMAELTSDLKNPLDLLVIITRRLGSKSKKIKSRFEVP